MNAQRRKEIQTLAGRLSDIISEIEAIEGDEQEYYDNMPESLQQSEKYQLAQSAIDALQSARDSADEAVNSLEEAANA